MAKDSKKSRNITRQLEAKAKAAQAGAEAEKARAEAAQIAAQLERDRIAAETAKREAEAAARSQKQKFDSVVSAGTYATGFVGGKAISAGIDKSIKASIGVKNKALADLAKETSKLVEAAGGDSAAGKRATAKLQATVATADKVGVTKTGTLKTGAVTGIGLIATGVATRMMGAQQEDETLKTIYTSLGTAEIVAGGTVLYSQMKSAAAPKALPDVKSLAQIEQARAIAAPGTPEAPAKPQAPKATKPRAPAKPGAKKAAAASKTLVAGMTDAGKAAPIQSAAKAAGKKVASGALRALGPVAVALASVAAVTGSAQAGENTTQQIARGVTAAADAATFGVAGMVSEAVKSKETIKVDHREAARAAHLASAERKLAAGGKLTRAEERAVEEKRAAEGDAPKAISQEALVSFNLVAGVTSLAAGVVTRSPILKAAGAANLTLAAINARDLGERSGKAYLNDQAERKAATVPQIDPAVAGAMMAGAAMRSDGRTEGYQRRSRNGLVVNVQGYRTPGR
jgi:hypothetical protein